MLEVIVRLGKVTAKFVQKAISVQQAQLHLQCVNQDFTAQVDKIAVKFAMLDIFVQLVLLHQYLVLKEAIVPLNKVSA